MLFSSDDLRDIEYIQFGILSAEEMVMQSVCEVTTSKLYGPNSVYDERMGSMETIKRCPTCGLSNKDCIGHFGHITLATPILHPLYGKLVLCLLKCVCYQCSRVLLLREQLELNGFLKYNRHLRFQKIIKKMDRVDVCSHCECQQPRYVFSSTDRSFFAVWKNDQSSRTLMRDGEIFTIFQKMSHEEIRLLGLDPAFFHPQSLILTVLPVVPPIARPYIMADNIMCDDDLTMQYTEIVKVNHHIHTTLQGPPVTTVSSSNEQKIYKYVQSLKFRIKSLFDNSGDRQRLSNGRPLKGIKKRLTGKEGLIRNNLMGKRVDKSARTVIGPDPTLHIDEIAIPPEIAETLCVPVQVTDYNKAYVQSLIESDQAKFLLRDNGNRRINIRYASTTQGTRLCFGDIVVKTQSYRKQHRHQTDHILVRNDRDLFLLDQGDVVYRNGVLLNDIQPPVRRPVDIRVGDIVERKLHNGDILLLNRQPTLHKGSMIAQKVVIRPGKTIRMNLATTKTFNADFDGDEMNLHCPASPETEAELRCLSSIENHLISCQSSRANIVIVQDALLGAYLMTLSKEPCLSRDHFFQCVMSIPDIHLPSVFTVLERYRQYKDVPSLLYHGRVLFSLLLPTDFSFEKENGADPQEPVLKIDGGLLCQGAINKSNLSSSPTSLITLLFHEYGTQTCTRFLNHVQFLTNQYLFLRGFSISMADCLIAKTDEIDRAITRAYMKAKNYELHIRHPRLKEVYIMHALSGARDMGMRIAQTAMTSDNNFMKTVVSGAKGDYFNIAQITGLLGQQSLNGQRIEPLLSNHRRSLPHYPLDKTTYTDDMRYESQGFIRSSFIDGLNPREFYFHTMTGREGITDTAMKTATSGYIQRRMVKLAEDLQVQYDGTVRNTSKSIIQFCYGDNNMNPVHTQFEKGQAIPCQTSRIIDRLNRRFETSIENDA